MSEPSAIAERAEEVVPGVWRWFVSNERIGGAESTSHAVRSDDGIVLIDPVRLAGEALARLEDVRATCLT
ncbi:MAG: MBL fold metallo-hydrolase, partial [Gaiellaceae bacterium]